MAGEGNSAETKSGLGLFIISLVVAFLMWYYHPDVLGPFGPASVVLALGGGVCAIALLLGTPIPRFREWATAPLFLVCLFLALLAIVSLASQSWSILLYGCSLSPSVVFLVGSAVASRRPISSDCAHPQVPLAAPVGSDAEIIERAKAIGEQNRLKESALRFGLGGPETPNEALARLAELASMPRTPAPELVITIDENAIDIAVEESGVRLERKAWLLTVWNTGDLVALHCHVRVMGAVDSRGAKVDSHALPQDLQWYDAHAPLTPATSVVDIQPGEHHDAFAVTWAPDKTGLPIVLATLPKNRRLSLGLEAYALDVVATCDNAPETNIGLYVRPDDASGIVVKRLVPPDTGPLEVNL